MRRAPEFVAKTVLCALISGAALLPGCDLPVDFWEEQQIAVQDMDAQHLTISQSKDVDVSKNEAVAKSSNLIKNVRIPELWLEIGEIRPDNAATVVSGSMTITSTDDS